MTSGDFHIVWFMAQKIMQENARGFYLPPVSLCDNLPMFLKSLGDSFLRWELLMTLSDRLENAARDYLDTYLIATIR